MGDCSRYCLVSDSRELGWFCEVAELEVVVDSKSLGVKSRMGLKIRRRRKETVLITIQSFRVLTVRGLVTLASQRQRGQRRPGSCFVCGYTTDKAMMLRAGSGRSLSDAPEHTVKCMRVWSRCECASIRTRDHCKESRSKVALRGTRRSSSHVDTTSFKHEEWTEISQGTKLGLWVTERSEAK